MIGENDSRGIAARKLAEQVERELRERTSADIYLQNGAANTFHIIWNSVPAGELSIFIPKSEQIHQRTSYVLKPPGSTQTRTYTKLATLLDKIVGLCRPLTPVETERQAYREKLASFDEAIDRIEGEYGSIARYLLIHRMVLAGWLANQDPERSDVPIELRALIKRLRELIERSSRLHDRRAAAEDDMIPE